MCVPVHCSSDVAVTEYFLYILGACSALNQIRREGVPQEMKVEVFKSGEVKTLINSDPVV